MQKSSLFLELNNEDKDLYQFVDSYLKDYCDFFGLTVDDVNGIKERFSIGYRNDIENFLETGKYPNQLIPEVQRTLDRIEYDIILISSYLLEKHRFSILKWLASKEFLDKKILTVGVGPGVEIGVILEFLGSSCAIKGYDIDLGDFVIARYGNKVKKEMFLGSTEKFDTVVLIEILEHLSAPLELLDICSKSMAGNGRLYATTALDIPQFDHLYNFRENEIVDLCDRCGLTVIQAKKIEHGTILSKINSVNEVIEAIKQ